MEFMYCFARDPQLTPVLLSKTTQSPSTFLVLHHSPFLVLHHSSSLVLHHSPNLINQPPSSLEAKSIKKGSLREQSVALETRRVLMRGGREHAPPVTELSASTADMSTTTDTDEDTSVEIDGDNSANGGPS